MTVSKTLPETSASQVGASNGAACLQVFYDGGCPLCRREIAYYRRLDPRQPIRWVDISPLDTDLSAVGITREQAMRVFHVQDLQGNLRRGAEAFLALWEALPRWRRLAQLVRFLRLQTIVEWLYQGFARRRYRARCGADGCSIAS